MQAASDCDISVVIPVYNEEDSLPELHRRLQSVLEDTMQVSYEIVFVDDGSEDKSWQLIEEFTKDNRGCKGVRFSRNFGHHIALTAGLDYTCGRAVVLMDADLQDPPEEIPKLYGKLADGYDVVYAIRATRDDPFTKKLSSKCFHYVFRSLTKIDMDANSGIFRVISRRAADALKRCRERARLIVGLASWTGFSQVGVPTRRHARGAGTTKYNFLKSLRLAMDGITAFSYHPLRLATHVGVFVALVSLGFAAYMVLRKLIHGIPVPGYASIIVAILFVGSVQLLVLGVMGEYLGRIYTEAQGRPLYIVSDVSGYDATEGRYVTDQGPDR